MDEDQSELVGDWLHSLQLVQYTQAFLDNGYDDLEVCKQIGHPDLDAIGVTDPDHRQVILESVQLLNSQDPTPLYYILENRTFEEHYKQLTNHDIYGTNENGGGEQITDGYAEGRRAFVTFPKLHLCAIVRDKLAKHGIKLTQKPFINQDGTLNEGAVEDISRKFASELKTHPQDVLDRIHDLMEYESSPSEQEEGEVEGDGFTLYSLGGGSRAVPPPLPACPCPSRSSRRDTVGSGDRLRHDSPSTHRSQDGDGSLSELNNADEISVLESGRGEEAAGKQEGAIGKLIGTIRGRPTRKYIYRKVEGDLNASEITMGDEERIRLMLMVKEGAISKDEAVEAVKVYESRRRRERGHLEASSSAESASQRSNKSAKSQELGSRSSSSVTSSPEPSVGHSVLLYEGTGTQMYSPVHGVRKKVTQEPTKVTKASGFFSSPKGSPARQSRWSKAFSSEADPSSSPKSKKKSGFSSPFSIRKKSCQAKDLWETPRMSMSSLQDDSGVFVSPSNSRHGSFTLTQEVHNGGGGGGGAGPRGAAQVQERLQSFTAVHPGATGPQRETIAVVHHSPHHTSPQSPPHCDHLHITSNASSKMVTFQTFQQKRLSSDLSYVKQLDTIAAHCDINMMRTSSKDRILIPSQNSHTRRTSQSCERLHSRHTHSSSSLQQCDTTLTTTHIRSRDSSEEFHQDSISPKRRNSPSGSPVDSQSPKRQHFSSSPNSTYNKGDGKTAPLNCGPTSPDQGIDTSPSSTIGSGGRDHYGSSSTMSVGSETSPSCTIERTTLKAPKKLIRKTLDKQRGRSHSFSTGDEYLSSDLDETQEQKHLERNSGVRRSLEQAVTSRNGHSGSKVTTKVHFSGNQVQNGHSGVSKAKGGVSSSESRSSMSLEDDGHIRCAQHGTRTRKQTVDGVLRRLKLPHLTATFKAHDIANLAVFCDLNEGILNEMGIQNSEERAKILTAAQMISDFEDRSSESAPSSVTSSPCHAASKLPVRPSQQHSAAPHSATNLTAAPHSATNLTAAPHSTTSLTAAPHSATNLTATHNGACSHLRTQRSPSPSACNSTSASGLPFYENIDNFEHAIPESERLLTNFACQCEFDAELSQVVTVDKPPDFKQNSVFYNAQSHPHHASTRSPSKSKAGAAEKTGPDGEGSSSSTGSSPSASPVKYKDASTQHGGILYGAVFQMLMRSGSLVKSSPSPGAGGRTAELTLFKSPLSKGRHAATMPKLGVEHLKKRHVSEGLLTAVHNELLRENIDLTQQPYSSAKGRCGIPPALVRRYAEELQIDLHDMASAFEALRMRELKAASRHAIANWNLREDCLTPAALVMSSRSLTDFFTSIGLPQYTQSFTERTIHSIDMLLNNVHLDDLGSYGISNPGHIRRLRHSIKQLRPQRSTQNGDIRCDQPKRTDSGYSTIDRVKSKKTSESKPKNPKK